ncbi:unnamed protein product, partial [Brachionus calyciflorus]
LANYTFPMEKYPLMLLEDPLSLDFKISMILKWIDIKLILKLRQILKIENCLKINLNKTDTCLKRQNIELRNLKATLINSVLNIFFKLFDLLLVVHSFLHFFTLHNAKSVDTEFQFNYVESTVKRSPLRRRDEANSRERARFKAAIDARTAAITKADIDTEGKRQWIKTGVTGRSRISGLDRDAAFKRLKQKIEFEEEQQKHLDFLERYRENPES